MTSQRILMRLGKSPFDMCSGIETLERNTIGGNNGNLIFGAAAHKLFSVEDVEVVPNHYKINGDYADEVNAEYDGFILPLANAFRSSFQAEMKRTTAFIERLKIPFMMLSGGAQISMDGNFDELKGIEDTVKQFARAVLDKSSALSVRGERTAEYLNSLGFRDVIVVGCPSMTMNGRGHRVEKSGALELGADIAYNIQTPKPFLGALMERSEKEYNATYFPQDRSTFEMMITGTDPYRGKDARLPLARNHQQFTERVAEFHLDAAAWIDRMREMRFSFGPRIHGNIAAILAGTPAVVVAHDARTRELADYHEIPRVLNEPSLESKTVQELYEEADFTGFNAGHAERFDRLSNFIHENGFAHIYDEGQESARAKYEDAVLNCSFPEPQKTITASASTSVEETVAVAHFQSRKLARVQGELEKERVQVRKLSMRVRELSEDINAAKAAASSEASAPSAKQSRIGSTLTGVVARVRGKRNMAKSPSTRFGQDSSSRTQSK